MEKETNLTVIKFNNDIEMYNRLEEMLTEGYEIVNTIGLSLEVVKNENRFLLTFAGTSDIKNIDVTYPDYDDTVLGVISDIRNSFGKPYSYNMQNTISKKHEHYVILILDGLASHILKLLPDDSFLKKHYLKDIHALYPSTTAAATTSIKAGLSPLETGWTGWENYFKEVNRNLILFSGKNYYTEEATGVNTYKLLPYKMFYDDLEVKANVYEPDFSNPNYEFKDTLKRSLMGLKNGDKIQYVYHPDPDGSLHELGLCDTVIERIIALDKTLSDYASKLPSDTVLYITADHGHIDVKHLDFYGYHLFYKMLNRNPSNDSRCITFSVKKEYMDEFPKLFNLCFKNIYKLYKTSDFINEGFIGKGIKNERLSDFLGDYVALAINEYYFNYKGKDNFIFKSHHAGITTKEMVIPLCVFEVE